MSALLAPLGCFVRNHQISTHNLTSLNHAGFNIAVVPAVVAGSNTFLWENKSLESDMKIVLDSTGDSVNFSDQLDKQMDLAVSKNAFGVYIRGPFGASSIVLLANILAKRLSRKSLPFVYVEYPTCPYLNECKSDAGCCPDERGTFTDPWLAWNHLRNLLPPNYKVLLSLKVVQNTRLTEEEQLRWAGEPVTFINLDDNLTRSYYKLGMDHKEFLARLAMRRDLKLLYDGPLVSNCTLYSPLLDSLGELSRFLGQFCPSLSYWKRTYDDLLNPLQPLRDNLDPNIYKQFELDPIKYELYHRALYEAIADKVNEIHRENLVLKTGPGSVESCQSGYSSCSDFSESNSEISSGLSTSEEDFGAYLPRPTYAEVAARSLGTVEKKNVGVCHRKCQKAYEKPWIDYKSTDEWKPQKIDEEIAKTVSLVILVVGAGRGPLVAASLQAFEKAKLASVTIHVVEKNPLVINTLKGKIATWSHEYPSAKLFLHHKDMRCFTSPDKADIVVSELLGSFGDNELSPECLDGVCDSLKENAICIPQSYTSYIQPIMSSKLYYKVIDSAPLREEDCFAKVLESHYVVNMRSYYSPCDPEKVFEFTHYRPSVKKSSSNNNNINRVDCNKHNEASAVMKFNNSIDFTCHGFAGYFSTQLYRSIKMSILPKNHTKNLFSWFPIYFPLRKPIFVEANSKLTVMMNRRTNGSAVWYDLKVTEPISLPVQNFGGMAHSIAL